MLTTSKAKQIVAWSIIAVLLAFFTIKTFFVGYYRIPQNGMYPTLPAGSIFFTAKHPYSDSSRVKRGDIIVFVREQNGQRYNYIWRVVALPVIRSKHPASRSSLTAARSNVNASATPTGKRSFGSILAMYHTRLQSIHRHRTTHPTHPSPFYPTSSSSWAIFDSMHLTVGILVQFHLIRLSVRSYNAKQPNQPLQPTPKAFASRRAGRRG